MWNQIRRLTKLQVCNLWNINEILHSNDRKKKNRYLLPLAVWVLLAIMMAGYAGGMVFLYIQIGLAQIVPTLLFAASSIYVMNTMSGYIFMILFAAWIFIVRVEQIKEILKLHGVIAKAGVAVNSGVFMHRRLARLALLSP